MAERCSPPTATRRFLSVSLRYRIAKPLDSSHRLLQWSTANLRFPQAGHESKRLTKDARPRFLFLLYRNLPNVCTRCNWPKVQDETRTPTGRKNPSRIAFH